MIFPKKEIVNEIRNTYPAGTRVELTYMKDPFSDLQPGDMGTVTHVDDIGTVFVNWDCGSRLGIVYGEDAIRRIDEC